MKVPLTGHTPKLALAGVSADDGASAVPARTRDELHVVTPAVESASMPAIASPRTHASLPPSTRSATRATDRNSHVHRRPNHLVDGDRLGIPEHTQFHLLSF